jgi:hypothetical protein
MLSGKKYYDRRMKKRRVRKGKKCSSFIWGKINVNECPWCIFDVGCLELMITDHCFNIKVCF